MTGEVLVAGCRIGFQTEALVKFNLETLTDLDDGFARALQTLRDMNIPYKFSFVANPRRGSDWRDIFLITTDAGVIAFRLAGGLIF